MNKLVIVTNSLTGGGAERAMNQITHELVKYNDVFLIAINSGNEDFVKPKGTVIELNRPWQGGIFRTIYALGKFRRKVSSLAPDLIILNCDLPEFFGCFLSRKYKIIVIEHVNYPFNSRKSLGRLIRKSLRAKGAKFASVSSHLPVWPNSEKPEFILENPLGFQFVPNNPNSATQPITGLIFIGRLVNPQKQPDLAIRIAAAVDLPITIIGDGPLRLELEKLALSLEVEAKFLGHVVDPWSQIERGSLLLLTSAFEGDGLVAIEAFRLNVPLLLTSIIDFRRFGLPDVNYGDSIEDFAHKIELNKSDLGKFLIDDLTRINLTASRMPSNISLQWEEMINLVLKE